jgi:hypothetical protein
MNASNCGVLWTDGRRARGAAARPNRSAPDAQQEQQDDQGERNAQQPE